VKVRTGFVANSSSASFVVLLDPVPQRIREAVIESLRELGFTWHEADKLHEATARTLRTLWKRLE